MKKLIRSLFFFQFLLFGCGSNNNSPTTTETPATTENASNETTDTAPVASPGQEGNDLTGEWDLKMKILDHNGNYKIDEGGTRTIYIFHPGY